MLTLGILFYGSPSTIIRSVVSKTERSTKSATTTMAPASSAAVVLLVEATLAPVLAPYTRRWSGVVEPVTPAWCKVRVDARIVPKAADCKSDKYAEYGERKKVLGRHLQEEMVRILS